MKKKQARFAMLVFVILATTSCTDIMGIDSDYYLRGRCDDQPRPVSDEIQDGANYVAVDATNVYWTNRSDGRVMKMAIDDGLVTELAISQNQPRCIAVDATYVYWTNKGIEKMPNTGTVMRIKIDRSEITPTELAAGQNFPYDIAVNDEFVYWTNEGSSLTSTDGDVMQRKLDLSMPAESIAPLPPHLPQQYPQSITVDKTNVYWTNAKQVTKKRDGSEPTILGKIDPPNTVTGYSSIAVNGGSVFWTSTDENTVNTVRPDGSDRRSLASSPTPFGIAVDATDVYWTSSNDGTVWRVGINGGVAKPMAENQAYPVGIAVDETCIYWANFGDGTVMKLAK